MILTETEQEVKKVIISRWKLGRKKYGEGISFHQSQDPEKWLDEAIEEAADLLQYLVAMKLRMKVKKNENSTTKSNSN
jgi:hypothetical protein